MHTSHTCMHTHTLPLSYSLSSSPLFLSSSLISSRDEAKTQWPSQEKDKLVTGSEGMGKKGEKSPSMKKQEIMKSPINGEWGTSPFSDLMSIISVPFYTKPWAMHMTTDDRPWAMPTLMNSTLIATQHGMHGWTHMASGTCLSRAPHVSSWLHAVWGWPPDESIVLMLAKRPQTTMDRNQSIMCPLLYVG